MQSTKNILLTVLFRLCIPVQSKILLKPVTGIQPTSLVRDQGIRNFVINKSPPSPHPTIVFVGLCVLQPVVGFSFHWVMLKSP